MSKIKEETVYGHCRCCLEEGAHRDITKVYLEENKQEVYTDIFLNCFNLFLSTNTNLSTLICNNCVNRLRDARDFKELVLKTEQQLIENLQEYDSDQMVLVNVPIPEDTLETTVGFKIELNNTDWTTENLNTQNFIIEPGIMNSININPSAEGIKYSSPRKLEQYKKKMALLTNTCTLLEYSNAILFKSKMRAGYPCFYCRDIFYSFEMLRSHQSIHSKSNLRKALKKYTAESLVVYADVTDLRCLICDMVMKDLKELKSHLSDIHERKFYPKCTDRVVPFKMLDSYFECQICWFNFETFGAIERHMNTHYRNYVCSECGSGFVTSLRLKSHVQTIHKVGTFPCDYCDRVFTTQIRQKCHVDFVHKLLKKLKCQKCSECFSDYFVQKKHMVEVHGEMPIYYRCNVCFKSFSRRYTLSCHMKRHINQKDVQCDHCSYTCYTKTELREHMLKHSKFNNGKVMCTICNKNFSRKKTLKEHMRIHNDDRRYVCNVCQQRFIQSNSLRTHIKNYHM